MDLKFSQKIIFWKYCEKYKGMKFRMEKKKIKKLIVKKLKLKKLQEEAIRFTGKSLKEILERKSFGKDKIPKDDKGNNLTISRLI